MLQIDCLKDWRSRRAQLGDIDIGFVPTMGALHSGHASLIRRCVKENDVTVVSIFINPTQFDQAQDLKQYPRSLETDARLARRLDVDYLLIPSGFDVYPDEYRYRVVENSLSATLEGAHRQGHFDGVLTVVLKLLNLVRPDRAYFGEKDFQQLELIRGMVEAFFLDVEIVACPTVRETDGLVASSRNEHLTPEQRSRAGSFPALLESPRKKEQIVRELERRGFRVDYVEEMRGRLCAAVRLGEVRLIDNVPSRKVQS